MRRYDFTTSGYRERHKYMMCVCLCANMCVSQEYKTLWLTSVQVMSDILFEQATGKRNQASPGHQNIQNCKANCTTTTLPLQTKKNTRQKLKSICFHNSMPSQYTGKP